jgi:hypothetical protein
MLYSEENENTSNNEADETSKDKVIKPPLIFVQGVKIISPLTELLNAKAKDNYEIKLLKFDIVKIQPFTSEFCTVIIQALEEKKMAFRTVLKPYTTPPIVMIWSKK